MRDVDYGSAVERIEAYLARTGNYSAGAEEIASVLDIEVGTVRCALRELACDGLLDDEGDEDEY